jgi:uncharacterized RDD family membrane protein YckC
MLDTPRVVTTPEGIELTLNVAGPVARARAWVIDALIRVVAYIALATAAAAFGGFGTGITLLFLFSAEWAYPVLFEVFWNGATPGKRACHLRVLHDDGTPVSWRASVIRNTIRAVDFLPFMYGFGLISCLLNRDFKRLGDLAAGTVVVYVPPSLALSPALRAATSAVARHPFVETLAVPHAIRGANHATKHPVPLRLDEQRAVINFAERRVRWSDQRANELAQHASELIEGAQGGAAVDRLVWLADEFTGRRANAATEMGRR